MQQLPCFAQHTSAQPMRSHALTQSATLTPRHRQRSRVLETREYAASCSYHQPYDIHTAGVSWQTHSHLRLMAAERELTRAEELQRV
jgi:hypothetical protein